MRKPSSGGKSPTLSKSSKATPPSTTRSTRSTRSSTQLDSDFNQSTTVTGSIASNRRCSNVSPTITTFVDDYFHNASTESDEDTNVLLEKHTVLAQSVMENLKKAPINKTSVKKNKKSGANGSFNVQIDSDIEDNSLKKSNRSLDNQKNLQTDQENFDVNQNVEGTLTDQIFDHQNHCFTMQKIPIETYQTHTPQKTSKIFEPATQSTTSTTKSTMNETDDENEASSASIPPIQTNLSMDTTTPQTQTIKTQQEDIPNIVKDSHASLLSIQSEIEFLLDTMSDHQKKYELLLHTQEQHKRLSTNNFTPATTLLNLFSDKINLINSNLVLQQASTMFDQPITSHTHQFYQHHVPESSMNTHSVCTLAAKYNIFTPTGAEHFIADLKLFIAQGSKPDQQHQLIASRKFLTNIVKQLQLAINQNDFFPNQTTSTVMQTSEDNNQDNKENNPPPNQAQQLYNLPLSKPSQRIQNHLRDDYGQCLQLFAQCLEQLDSNLI